MSLYSIAEDVLEAAAASLVSPPSRQYVTVGETSWDICEQLTVNVTGIYPGQAVGNAIAGTIGCAVQPVAQMCIELVRCVPGLSSKGDPPTEAQLLASGQEMVIDMDDLFCGIVARTGAGSLFAGQDKNSVKIESISAIGPQGGMVGVKLCLEIRSSCGSMGS